MHRFKLIVLGTLLAMSASTGAATNSAGCFCSVVYYNDAGTVVGIRQPAACGDTGWGETTNKSKVYAGCVM
ncbi:DUF6289 family protein [Lysobacter capsici]|jgi:hypothetical protein|uniref:Secreted protein n=1 Tax=Lysobacter capsici AZ78 TaxID=1444315 RepID=A0A108U5G8_9GAMM|nr:DUF6289 family protein [Lysobacter capsici]ALN85946.1 hypothetical protein LC55x_2681 [Lysobacter capsici]KWS02909.1 hypothetical protein AZ78_0455 [Lysobacter capsici AZ78]UOF17365.1 DUF6289 family protein [Lysobacter capsici]WND83084.1 DUF6289 family protein [Lysobacter capsici]WND88283.1 DUF6289 family protein [Lysobacter capsici]